MSIRFMNPIVRPVLFIFAWLALAATSLSAQVTASLVSASPAIIPGQPFAVALRLDHEPKWHTYWVNPGTGYPTSLAWELPPGWTAGEIDWPTPMRVKDTAGNITGIGYEDVTYLPVTLTPPDDLLPGQSLTLRVKAEWLMCKEVCIPGEASLELTLPVANDSAALATLQASSPPPDTRALQSTLASLPRPLPAWGFAASRVKDRIALRLTPPADYPGTVRNLTFFAEDALIGYDLPQTLRKNDDGTFSLLLEVSSFYEGPADRLVGVLRQEDGWSTDDVTRQGLRLDVPLTPGTAAEVSLGSSASSTDRGPLGFAAVLGLAFLGGLILNLMPCVFPVLGIKILGFVNQAGQDRRKVTLHGLAFTAGVLASFWVLAAALALLRAGGQELGWGFQLQEPAFVFIMTVVMLVFALSMSGVFEFGLRATGVGSDLQRQQGVKGSFFTGVLATIVATPCSAPFLAPALGAALALPTTEAFIVFTAIALGLSLPYLLLSLFPSAVKALPRPGAWMETFKEAMAFPLYATAGLLIWVLAGQIPETGLLYTLLGLTLIAMAVWFYGRYTAPGASVARARLGRLVGLLLLALGLATGWPRATSPDDIVWEDWSTDRVAALRAEGRSIYIDFTARWCFTCQTNKAAVFSSSEVLRVFREQNIATLRADWTNRDDAITAELARWNRAAVPFNLIYLPDRDDPAILPELLTPGTVLDALAPN